jgi:tetratricopeptide (TPR) repeat protein
MKKIIFGLSVLAVSLTNAQVRTPAQSPAAKVTQTVGLTDVTVEYSRPAAKGRTIFGNLVPFGKLWRTGANKNTVISFSDDVVIDGKTLAKGSYALFTTPKADNWEVIFYKNTENWGTPAPFNESDVALRTNVKPVMTNNHVENFTLGINNLDNNYGHIEISWEKTMASVKFTVPTHATAMANIERALGGPSSADYFAAAQYFYSSNGDMDKALSYVNKSLELSKDKPFYYYRLKSLIQAKTGDKKGAIETAKISLSASEAANNADYVKMNKESIEEWSKK